MANYKIYVAGWYFEEYKSFYDALLPIKDHVVIGAHRRIPQEISSVFKAKRYPNLGLAMGVYEQLRLDKEFSEIDTCDYVIFMQDDADILRFFVGT